jgi:hypothetical protein
MERFFHYFSRVNPMRIISKFSTKSMIEIDLTLLCRIDKDIVSLCSFLLVAKRKENETVNFSCSGFEWDRN